jgi:hypothetical protein
MTWGEASLVWLSSALVPLPSNIWFQAAVGGGAQRAVRNASGQSQADGVAERGRRCSHRRVGLFLRAWQLSWPAPALRT